MIFDFAACNGIYDPATENGFRIYPNPGDGSIRIENQSGICNCQVSVVDIFGREIIKNQDLVFSYTDHTFNLDLNSYPPGIYLIKISENGKYLASVKYLLKQ